MVRSIEVLLELGSLPAFLQVKGGFPTLQRVVCPVSTTQALQDPC
jgi:hypothetical protein